MLQHHDVNFSLLIFPFSPVLFCAASLASQDQISPIAYSFFHVMSDAER